MNTEAFSQTDDYGTVRVTANKPGMFSIIAMYVPPQSAAFTYEDWGIKPTISFGLIFKREGDIALTIDHIQKTFFALCVTTDWDLLMQTGSIAPLMLRRGATLYLNEEWYADAKLENVPLPYKLIDFSMLVGKKGE